MRKTKQQIIELAIALSLIMQSVLAMEDMNGQDPGTNKRPGVEIIEGQPDTKRAKTENVEIIRQKFNNLLISNDRKELDQFFNTYPSFINDDMITRCIYPYAKRAGYNDISDFGPVSKFIFLGQFISNLTINRFYSFPDELISYIFSFCEGRKNGNRMGNDSRGDYNALSCVSQKFKIISDSITYDLKLNRNKSQNYLYEKINEENRQNVQALYSLLGRFTNLMTLKFDQMNISVKQNDIVARLPNLTKLCLSGNYGENELSDAGLTQLQQLRSLDLGTNKIITDTALTQLQQLRSLNLRYNNAITNDGLGLLTNLTHLVFSGFYSAVNNSYITGTGISKLINLKHLDLSGVMSFDDACLVSLINLKSLNLYADEINRSNLNFTSSGFRNLTNLTNLNIRYVAHTHREPIDPISLHELYERGCKITFTNFFGAYSDPFVYGQNEITFDATKIKSDPELIGNKVHLWSLKNVTVIDMAELISNGWTTMGAFVDASGNYIKPCHISLSMLSQLQMMGCTIKFNCLGI